ncbi:sulfatase-like hydrolase/transferase [Chondromyces crocatus]|uniref:Sulfatase N-terminal domain-containing protein n=1 Tax=Chondromyces crocatus TaxID=52 RepID=A0A0K1EAL8_CHOCO|nr:sulfatase-like hydrolase/transferase [Chondromyces crocatus]AKT37904.1 uncharacterized protein CMC5_020470 [Chondromyces crocatus]
MKSPSDPSVGRRRLPGIAILLAPGLFVLVSDVVRRWGQIVTFDRPHALGYAASAVGSLLFWALLLHAASPRAEPEGEAALTGSPRSTSTKPPTPTKRPLLGARIRRALTAARHPLGALFVLLFTLSMGVQAGYHGFYNLYCSRDSQIHSASLPWSLVCTLPLSRPAVLLHLALALGLALVALRLARRWVQPGFAAWAVSTALTPLAFWGIAVIPVSYRLWQSSMPDQIYVHGLVATTKEQLGITNDSPDRRVQRRRPEKVPPLSARPARPRNVLLILQESQRFDVTCVDPELPCDQATPFTHRAMPDRLPLLQARAHASTTAISISNLWSGVSPTERFDTLHTAPLLWEYAHAAGWDTAYWTSQHIEFGNMRLYLQDIPVSHRAAAANLDPRADLDYGAYDRLLTDRAIQEIGELREPFLAVAHYSNIHYPYVADPAHSPFQPSEMNKAPEKNERFRNHYRNVVYLSDLAVGRLVDHLRATDAGKRTVIVYTSDHGESFREHWQLGHTSSLYEEEIRVPTWVDAPEGTLSPDEEASLRSARTDFVWHLDLATTLLDLLGVWDDPAFAPFRARMPGLPVTRPARTVGPMPLTNCTWVWECEFRNWGMMQGPMKIEAREWDGEFHCFNVLNDPDEVVNLGESACAPLPDLARALFHEMPVVTPPGRPVVNWGK